MHAVVKETICAIIGASALRPRRALEVGGLMGPKSLLRCPGLRRVDRYCLNLRPMASARGIKAVRGNANDMGMFEDETFDLVVSNATLEHDKQFWLSVGEMHRVLAPGGLLIIGAPGYIENPERDRGRATSTYQVHFRFDYYRFSAQAFREVFLAGMEDVAVQSILHPPRIIGLGFKPGGDRSAAGREAAARALDSGPATLGLGRTGRRARVRRLGSKLRARLGGSDPSSPADS
jgi:SAM-dependent methyltransferase